MEKRRDPYWDNVKLALIFLVVLGHFLLPVRKEEWFIETLYYWIYLFHMPAFVFVSGYFSKSYVRKKGKERRLTGYLLLYLLFTASLWLTKWIITRKFNWSVLLNPDSAPWYMLAMFFWLLLIPFAARLPFRSAFAASVAAALIAGMLPFIGSFLALSRVIVLFPFFLLGYHCNGYRREIINRGGIKIKILSLIVLVVPFIALYFGSDWLPGYLRIIYGRLSYQDMGLTAVQGVLLRSFWFCLAALMGAAFLCLIPNQELKVTSAGERTLGIYFVHRLIRDVFRNLDLYKYMGSGWILLLSCVAVSVLVTYVSSAKIITESLNRLFLLGCRRRKR